MRGFVQVYTGNGKGKTTAALGLAIRAAGAGLKVFIGQFVKGMPYSEFAILKRLQDMITIKQYGRECFIDKEPSEEDINRARQGLSELGNIILSGRYDLIIIDEVTIATYYNLFTTADILSIIDDRPEHVEIVITGRYAEPELLERADLVTEMKEIKHYYTRGIEARTGIEK